MIHIAVIDIATGEIVHCGSNLTKAARAFLEGRLFGTGFSAKEARKSARMRLRLFKIDRKRKVARKGTKHAT